MENFIGHDDFYYGIITYLHKYAYRNAETADLIDNLQNAVGSKLNIMAIMDTWMRQEGYPVINVEKQSNKFVLTQKRFLIDSNPNFDSSNYK